jgi:hypothetical protein
MEESFSSEPLNENLMGESFSRDSFDSKIRQAVDYFK